MFRITKLYTSREYVVRVGRDNEGEMSHLRRFMVFRTTLLIFWVIPIFTFDELRSVNNI